jgi:hypothetical protein
MTDEDKQLFDELSSEWVNICNHVSKCARILLKIEHIKLNSIKNNKVIITYQREFIDKNQDIIKSCISTTLDELGYEGLDITLEKRSIKVIWHPRE